MAKTFPGFWSGYPEESGEKRTVKKQKEPRPALRCSVPGKKKKKEGQLSIE
jgi:hypothetical protein